MKGRVEPDRIEIRFDKPYDEESVAHLIHPNGSLVDSTDRRFLGAAGRAVFTLLEESH